MVIISDLSVGEGVFETSRKFEKTETSVAPIHSEIFTEMLDNTFSIIYGAACKDDLAF